MKNHICLCILKIKDSLNENMAKSSSSYQRYKVYVKTGNCPKIIVVDCSLGRGLMLFTSLDHIMYKRFLKSTGPCCSNVG